MTMALFDRQIKLEFEGVNIQPITDLRIKFHVDKNDSQNLNHGIITITNLEPRDRAALAYPFHSDFRTHKPVIKVKLSAGYKGEVIQMMKGTLLTGVSSRLEENWVTELEVWAGIDIATNTEINYSSAKPTPAKTIVQELIKKMNMSVKYTKEADDILNKESVADYTTSGLAYVEADLFLKRYGLGFTITDDGEALVYLSGKPRDPASAKTIENTFSPESGLIGTPQVTRTGVEIISLLRPSVKILQRFFVESETIKETLQASPSFSPDYYVKEVQHSGDNRGEQWFTEIVGFYTKIKRGTL